MLAVWEASVRATHHFITENDIQFFKPLVWQAFGQAMTLACAYDTAHQVVGFVGVADEKIEMLFINPAWRGRGVGKQLLRYAFGELRATELDVNEQNEQAVGFYQHEGFAVVGRSERDGSGKPFPVLHMRLIQQP